MATRILLVDDHQIVREGLKALLDTQDGLQVIGQAASGREAIELARELQPDVVVMDVGMPDLNGIESTRRILNEMPWARVVALSMHSDRRFLSEMLKAGASAYLLKDIAFEELTLAVRSVASGRVYLSPQIANVVVDGYLGRGGSDQVPGGFAVLTSRKREVLQLIAEGETTKQIAAALHVSVKTVETHRRQLMEKLELRSVAELTKYAIREGLASVEG